MTLPTKMIVSFRLPPPLVKMIHLILRVVVKLRVTIRDNNRAATLGILASKSILGKNKKKKNNPDYKQRR